MLIRGSVGQYELFREALTETGQDHVAEVLCVTGKYIGQGHVAEVLCVTGE